MQKQDGTPVRSALGKAKRQNKTFSYFIEWIERVKALQPQELHGLPKLACQVNKQFDKFTTSGWNFLPKIRNWKQRSGITTNSTAINDARNLLPTPFFDNWRTLRSYWNFGENKAKVP